MVKNKSLIKSEKVTLIPEAGIGYLLGPTLALIVSGVVNTYLIQYWQIVLNLDGLFITLVPILSSILIVIGNLLVGRLMERKPSVIGKARPLILLGMPFIAIALLVLFVFVPFPKDDSLMITASILVAVGYNLYYAIAWPIYYTSHSALVNLSTRDDKKRGLLGTCAMAAQLAAAGLAGMVGPFLIDFLGLLPKEVQTIDGVEQLVAASPELREAANSKWVFMIIVLVGCLVAGCILEFLFTRERITEENIEFSDKKETVESKKVSIKDQIKVCVKDKYWWLIIIFFFLYQFGGSMKNGALLYYSIAFTTKSELTGFINTIGAIPTALGMVIVWPIANKIGKAKTIALGGLLAFISGMLSFLLLIPALGNNSTGVYAISIGSFILKALASSPAMYISVALMGNVLDHQEATHGIRTDGFTMAVYGSIMVAMAGICNGIIGGLNSVITVVGDNRVLNLILSFGIESVCFLIIFFIFKFMNVETYIKKDLEILKREN